MDDNDVYGRVGRYAVRRIRLPERAVESFTVIGPDLRPVELVDEYLAWLTDCERSPNTVEAYAHDLRAFWTFLAERGLRWDQVDVMELGEFAAWARRPVAKVDLTIHHEIVAICLRDGHKQAIPILDLALPAPAPGRRAMDRGLPPLAALKPARLTSRRARPGRQP